ncbi:MAG TPA: alcohol dehydrogenase catalytic domain-containing protein [Mycobacterium sp.]|uniref:alcohol dehydrogenase catalytic domain-containing protein n=1 Tax=Mycobacterium sp. TaxID=1785 RepID=UPI002CE0573D|nr:alcohol dehydrogenase catalytic domain-containing protein [Mycobacterium sp.]HME77210.1 alcohol dehydrogenase catalytic domain-containing protein [Mycobacterium sp.]
MTGQRQFRLVQRETRDPGPGEVRLRVQACGVCHTDVIAVEGLRADPSKAVVPGHEIAGVVDAVGPAVNGWRAGERVGVGFLNGHCGECEPCRRGDFVNCVNQQQTGTSVDGGYAEVAYARASGLVRLPGDMESVDVAPLLCAGLTVYSALLRAGARPGSVVAIQGIGGLGHLGIQYAATLGYEVVAIARGSEKATLAEQLGADHYIDSVAADPADVLRGLGGAAAIVATASNGASMSPLVAGLAPQGRLIVVGAGPEPLETQTADLIFGTRSIVGSLTGTSIENEDNLRLAQRRGIRSMNEIMPLSEAPKAYERMLSGQARFRIVLDTGSLANP